MPMKIHCPFCGEEFEEAQPMEEVLNPTATIIRKMSDRSTWHEIADRITNGQAFTMFNVGDSISCILKDGRTVLIDVAGINTYDDDEVIFCFRNPVAHHYINERNTNHGGFPESDVCSYMNSDIFELLPDDLQEVITPRKITQRMHGTEYSCEVTLWTPSVVEIGGEEYVRFSCEVGADKQFELFKIRRNRIKYDENDCTDIWATRSPLASNSTLFFSVYYYGYPGNYNSYAYYTYGIVPCFSIKKKRDVNENEEV